MLSGRGAIHRARNSPGTDPISYEYGISDRPHLVTREEQGDKWVEYEYHPSYDLVTKRTEPSPMALLYGGPAVRWTSWEYDGPHLVKRIEAGYTIDEDGWFSWEEHSTSYTRDDRGRLLLTKGPNVTELRSYYPDDTGPVNNRGRLESVSHLARQWISPPFLYQEWLITFYEPDPQTGEAYDVFGNPLWIRSAVSRVGSGIDYQESVRMVWDDQGRLVERIEEAFDELGAVVEVSTHFSYFSGDRIHTIVSPMGITTVYGYGDYGRLVSVSRFASGVDPFEPGAVPFEAVHYDHDLAGNRVLEQHVLYVAGTPQVRYEIRREFGPGRRIVKEIHPEDHSVYREYGYDAIGRIVAETDEAGRLKTFDFDSIGRITQVDQLDRHLNDDVYPQDVVTKYEYMTHDLVKQVEDANGTITTYIHDDFGGGKLTSMDADPGQVTFKYDPRGLVVEESTEAGIIEYTWDEDGNLVGIKYPRMLAVEYVRGQDGRVQTVVRKDPSTPQDLVGNIQYYLGTTVRDYERGNGGYREVGRNLRGEVTAIDDWPGLAWNMIAWSPTGSPESIAGNGVLRDFDHDDLERLVSANSVFPSFFSNMSYRVDAGGNRQERWLFGAKLDRYRYWPGTNLLREVIDPPFGGSSREEAGSMNAAWQESIAALEGTRSGESETEGAGHRGQWSLGRKLRELASRFEVEPATLIHVLLKETPGEHHDLVLMMLDGGWGQADGSLPGTRAGTSSSGDVEAQSSTTAEAGDAEEDDLLVSLASVDLEGGVAQTLSGGEDPVWVYYHDAAGYVTEVALRHENRPTPAYDDDPYLSLQVSVCMQYDELGRLVRTRSISSQDEILSQPLCVFPLAYSGSRSFWYDARGRRIREVRDHPLSSIAYQRRFAYDLADRLVVEEKRTTRRTTFTVNSVERVWLESELLTRQDSRWTGSGTGWGGTKAEEATYSYTVDHLGTPWALTDAQNDLVWQVAYADPFGGPAFIVEDIEENLRLPGQYDDGFFSTIGQDGPYYNWHRYYSPRIGRYLAEDPVKRAPRTAWARYFGAEPEAYGYALSAPMVLFDFTGLSPEDVERIKLLFWMEAMRMTWNRQRHPHPFKNNVVAFLDLVSASRLGWPYLACGDQASHMANYLQSNNHLNADNWFFREVAMLPAPHWRVLGVSSNEDDPILIIDPWLLTFEEVPQDSWRALMPWWATW